MALKKRIRIIKKISENAGVWKFISLHRIGSRYVWDKRPGYFFIEWWDGKKRKRERAGQTPSEATEAQRRKQNELIGELLANGKELPTSQEGTATPIQDAITTFTDHVGTHSPDKPQTHRHYATVLQHFERHLGTSKIIAAITRADVNELKLT